MNQFQRASLLGVVLVTLVAFGLGLPLVSAQGPSTRTLDRDETVGTLYGSVVLPAGWDLDIEAASQSSPVVSLDGLRVTVTDGLWFEDSAHLLTNVAALLYDNPPPLPEAPDDDGAFASLSDAEAAAVDPVRQEWRIEAPNAAEGEPLQVDVVRYDTLVELVIVRGDAGALTRHADAVDAITASVTFDDLASGLEGTP